MEQEIQQLRKEVKELQEWKRSRERQQITFPLDIASKTALGAPYGEGSGSATLTQSISLTGNPQSISVPAAYNDTLILVVDGVKYEIPYLAII